MQRTTCGARCCSKLKRRTRAIRRARTPPWSSPRTRRSDDGWSCRVQQQLACRAAAAPRRRSTQGRTVSPRNTATAGRPWTASRRQTRPRTKAPIGSARSPRRGGPARRRAAAPRPPRPGSSTDELICRQKWGDPQPAKFRSTAADEHDVIGERTPRVWLIDQRGGGDGAAGQLENRSVEASSLPSGTAILTCSMPPGSISNALAPRKS